MRARDAATAAVVAALLARADAFSLVLDAANSSSFRFSFSGSLHAALQFELWPQAGGGAVASPLLCGVAVTVPDLESATLTLTDLPESSAFTLTYTLMQGSGSAADGGSVWVVLPEAWHTTTAVDASSDTCWSCVFASLSLYSVVWTRALSHEGDVLPASRSNVSPLCSCWLCDGAGSCSVAPHDTCESARAQASPPREAVDASLGVPSTASPPPLSPVLPSPPSAPQPPQPPSPPLPPWFLEYWPQLAVPPPTRPPPPSVSGMAGAAPSADSMPPPPWWLGSRGTSNPPPPLRLNTTTGVPWWALLQEDPASPPPGSAAPADVVAQNFNGSPPGPTSDTAQVQQMIEGWLGAVPALAAPTAGGTSAAAVLSSVLADVISRAEAKRPTAAVATALGLGGAAAASVWNLWTSPVVGPYLLELWAQAESAVWPGAQGAG